MDEFNGSINDNLFRNFAELAERCLHRSIDGNKIDEKLKERMDDARNAFYCCLAAKRRG